MIKTIRYEHIDINLVKPDQYQPRQDWGKHKSALEDLIKDIEEHGQLVPIIVTEEKGTYLLQSGEKRWKAMQALGEETIDAKVITTDGKLEEYEVQFASDLKRNTPSIEEMAPAVERYKKAWEKQNGYHNTIRRLCAITGYSAVYFKDIESINNSPKAMRHHIDKGMISGYTPREIDNATRDEDFRDGLREAYVEEARSGKKLGANLPRSVKGVLAQQANTNLLPLEKVDLAKGLFLQKIGRTKTQKGNVLVYLNNIQEWQKIIDDTWSMNGLTTDDYTKIAGALDNLGITVEGLAQEAGIFPKK